MQRTSHCHAGISRSEISGAQGGRASPDRMWPWVPALGLTPEAGMTATMCGRLSCRNFASAKSPAPRAAEASPDRLRPWVPALGLTPEAGMTTDAAYLTLSCRNFAKRNLRHPELQTHRRTGCDPRSRLSG